MNPSLSILQKLKNLFTQSMVNASDYHVAFAPFAFSLTNEDFYFLQNQVITGADARKYLKEQSEFAYMANSVLKKPFIWTISGENQLSHLYKDILDDAVLINPDSLTGQEQQELDEARAVLYLADGSGYSQRYIKYKEYAALYAATEQKILDLNLLKGNLQTQPEVDQWNSDMNRLQSDRTSILLDWQVMGSKGAVESAQTKYNSICFSKTSFIGKWKDAKTNKLGPPNLLTDEYGSEFLSTTCVPNAICNYMAPIWKKIALTKQEIARLTGEFTSVIPYSVVAEFGDTDTQLDGITFEYCFIDIVRPWFEEAILNNSFWKFRDSSRLLSQGDDTMLGEIPAYPMKIILVKNIDLEFTPGSQQNEDLKGKLIRGERVFFGPLLLKTIPANLENDKIKSFRVQQVSANQLSVLTKVAVGATAPIAGNVAPNRLRMVEMMNRSSPVVVKRAVEMKSVRLAGIQPMAVKPVFTAGMRPPVTRPPAVKATITGRVVDESNTAVEGAEIQIMNSLNACTQSFLSLSDGSYRYSDMEFGTYHFSVRKTGYTATEKPIEIRGNANHDFVLPHQRVPTETFQVMGVICKKLPRLPDPIPGADYF